MADDVFNMFWHGRSLSPLELACMQSFVAHGHRLRVFAYEELSLPLGVECIDAREILPYERLFIFKESPSAFTNIFRYKLLFEQGGWWVDTDVLCRTSDLPACDYYWAEQQPGQLNGAVLKFPKSATLCGRLLELSEERAPRLKHWGQLGPVLLTEVLQEVRPEKHSGFTEDAYPLHWLEPHFFWLPEFAPAVQRRTSRSTFVHLWHSVFARMGINVECQAPAGSYLDTVYAAYHVSAPKPASESSDRGGIVQFLQQDWVANTWRHELGRDMVDLGIAKMLACCVEQPGNA